VIWREIGEEQRSTIRLITPNQKMSGEKSFRSTSGALKHNDVSTAEGIGLEELTHARDAQPESALLVGGQRNRAVQNAGTRLWGNPQALPRRNLEIVPASPFLLKPRLRYLNMAVN
jgi:hypothetical protein